MPGRARSSGRQPLSAASPPSGEHAPAAGRPHPGAEAVLLRAMPLLGLVGLLHRGCARSSPSGPGSTSSTPRGTQTRRAPVSAFGASVSGGLYDAPRRVSNSRAGRPRQGAHVRRRSRPARAATILPGSIAKSPCDGRSGGAILTGPSAPGRSRVQPRYLVRVPGATSGGAGAPFRETRDPGPPSPATRRRHPSSTAISRINHRPNGCQAGLARRARRAAGLAVPGQLRDVAAGHPLVDVDDQRFRIAVPNGFAKDWLETRYRSLISQTLARIVGYSVQVDSRSGRRDRVGGGRRPTPATPAPGDPPRPRSASSPVGSGRGRKRQPQPALHVRQFHRRLGQPPRPRREPVGRRAAGPRLRPAVPVRRGRPRQDPPDARDRQPGDRQFPRKQVSLRDGQKFTTSSSPRSSRARSTSSGPGTGGSTCS